MVMKLNVCLPLFFSAFHFLSLSSADQQLMICKPVSSVFETKSTNSTIQFPFPAANQNCPPSRPGKQGPRGLRGLPGPIGPPGKETIQDEAITRLQSEIQMIKRFMQCNDGIVVGNVCYKLLYRVGVKVNCETARSLCAFHGMGMAEIPTEQVYRAVYRYVQRSWYIAINQESLNYVEVWLGSSYDGRRNVTLTNGQQRFVRWFLGYPTSTSGHSRLCVVIEIQPGRGNNIGFFNINPEHTDATTPLCQFNVE